MTDLPAGRELDELVAVRVLGAEWMHWPGAAAQNVMVNPLDVELQLQRGLKMGRLDGNTPSIRPVKLSAHIEDAWMIVEHLRARGWSFDLCDTDTGQWVVVFGHDTHRVTAYGGTAPHAIALCALRAIALERAQEGQDG